MSREYAYKPKWFVMLAVIFFFGLCAGVLWYRADVNDRGLILNGLIEFSPVGASQFYRVLAVLGIGFVLMALIALVTSFKVKQRVVLTETSLTYPRSRWSEEHATIAYRDITGLRAWSAYGQRFLEVTHRLGKFVLVASMLPRKADFDDIRKEIEARRAI